MEIKKDLSNIQIPASALGKIIGLTSRRVNQLVTEGIIIRAENGKFNAEEQICRYCEYLRSGNETKSEQQADYWEEKALHEKAKRELTELKLAKTQGKMYEAKNIELVMGEMLANFRSRMLGIPSKAAPVLFAAKDKPAIVRELTREITEALLELKDYEPAMFMEEEEDEENLETDAQNSSPDSSTA